MSGYVINFEMDLYGPYYSEKQALFARQLFTRKHPKLAASCAILRINLDTNRMPLNDPRHLL